jgi:hypothetical protein
MSIRKVWGAFARPGVQATASRAGQGDLEQGEGGAPARCAMINAMGSANSPADREVKEAELGARHPVAP